MRAYLGGTNVITSVGRDPVRGVRKEAESSVARTFEPGNRVASGSFKGQERMLPC